MSKESIHVVLDENNVGSVSSTSTKDLRLSKYYDEEEDKAKSDKANTQSLSQSTLNPPEMTLKPLK